MQGSSSTTRTFPSAGMEFVGSADSVTLGFGAISLISAGRFLIRLFSIPIWRSWAHKGASQTLHFADCNCCELGLETLMLALRFLSERLRKFPRLRCGLGRRTNFTVPN